MIKVNFPRRFLTEDVSEGDYLTISIVRDAAATEAAEDAALDMLKE